MKIKLLFVVLSFFGMAKAQNTWTQKTPFPGKARHSAVGFSIGTKGYIGTGYNNPLDSVFSDFWEWNPEANTWIQKASFGGGARGWASGTSLGAKGYIGVGYDLFTAPGDFWEYDTASDNWTKKGLFSGPPSSNGLSFSIGSKLYLLGESSDFWEYNPQTNIWVQKTDYPGQSQFGQTGFSIGDKAYVGLGNITSSTFAKDFWEYNPEFDSWTPKEDFGGAARSAAVGFSIGSKGYIGTGSASPGGFTDLFKDFWEYNPVSNKWTRKADFGGTARSVASGFSIGTKGYIGIGWDASSSKNRQDFWEYTPDTATTSVKETVINPLISIYPNPFSGSTTLHSETMLSHATIIIFNTLGQPVKRIENISGHRLDILRDNLPAGLYFIQLSQENKIFTSNKSLLITDN